MALQEITLPLPESLYIRLQHAADATNQSLTDVVLRAVRIGSPPGWNDVPAEFQADLAALDRLDDDALWVIARAHQSGTNASRYQSLLDSKAEGTITAPENAELNQLREEADLLMLRKAHAVSLLRWRGHTIPPSDKLR